MGIDTEILALCLAQVQRTAKKMVRRLPEWVSLEDLIGAGNLGLAKAVRAFERNGSQGSFPAYASFRVRGEMLDSLRELDPLSRDQRIESRRFVVVADRLTTELGHAATEDEIAGELGLTVESFRQKRALFAVSAHQQLANPIGYGDDLDHEGLTPEDLLDEAERQARRRGALTSAMGTLPLRLRFIAERSLEGETLMAIGKQIGRTESRTSQLRQEAFNRIRKALHAGREGA